MRKSTLESLEISESFFHDTLSYKALNVFCGLVLILYVMAIGAIAAIPLMIYLAYFN